MRASNPTLVGEVFSDKNPLVIAETGMATYGDTRVPPVMLDEEGDKA